MPVEPLPPPPKKKDFPCLPAWPHLPKRNRIRLLHLLGQLAARHLAPPQLSLGEDADGR